MTVTVFVRYVSCFPSPSLERGAGEKYVPSSFARYYFAAGVYPWSEYYGPAGGFFPSIPSAAAPADRWALPSLRSPALSARCALSGEADTTCQGGPACVTPSGRPALSCLLLGAPRVPPLTSRGWAACLTRPLSGHGVRGQAGWPGKAFPGRGPHTLPASGCLLRGRRPLLKSPPFSRICGPRASSKYTGGQFSCLVPSWSLGETGQNLVW